MVGACIKSPYETIWLIPQYGQYGGGLGTVITEFMVTVIMILLGRKYFTSKYSLKTQEFTLSNRFYSDIYSIGFLFGLPFT